MFLNKMKKTLAIFSECMVYYYSSLMNSRQQEKASKTT
ncbi:hypothetical protein BAXH7_00158 [Bacillus amyloliquefaciens XH7]|nr:hypothetical protein LL3_00155 [Bacillus amyloliquefaciens LL3]AEK87310.1 hypothetical protein BAXH7_00158 [Bacillus amyloliquefaciens XH7]